VPGRASHVISRTIAELPAPEKRAVLAHEGAHLRLRHDHLLVLALYERNWGWLPGARAVADRHRHSVELWADMAAAGSPLVDQATCDRHTGGSSLGTFSARPYRSTGGTERPRRNRYLSRRDDRTALTSTASLRRIVRADRRCQHDLAGRFGGDGKVRLNRNAQQEVSSHHRAAPRQGRTGAQMREQQRSPRT